LNTLILLEKVNSMNNKETNPKNDGNSNNQSDKSYEMLKKVLVKTDLIANKLDSFSGPKNLKLNQMKTSKSIPKFL